MKFVESWLDDSAKKGTGMDSWFLDYSYWISDGKLILNKDYWNKVIFQENIPVGAISFSVKDKKLHIMEIIVSPNMRGNGIGSKIIFELVENTNLICNINIEKATATIFLNNIASQKAFCNAGFKIKNSHDDVLDYIWKKKSTN